MRTAIQGNTEDPVIERVIRLLTKQGKTQLELCTFLGVNRASFTKWKYGRSQSYMTRIDKIAEFLGVSQTYLLNCANEDVGTDNITSVEVEMIQQFRQLDGSSQAWITQALRFAIEANKKN